MDPDPPHDSALHAERDFRPIFGGTLSQDDECCQMYTVRVSQQNDNVLFVPNRNVLLTGARWGVGNGSTPDDTEGARPNGRAKESQEETDYAEASGRRGKCQRAAPAAHVRSMKARGDKAAIHAARGRRSN
jgi:hypothetical protein